MLLWFYHLFFLSYWLMLLCSRILVLYLGEVCPFAILYYLLKTKKINITLYKRGKNDQEIFTKCQLHLDTKAATFHNNKTLYYSEFFLNYYLTRNKRLYWQMHLLCGVKVIYILASLNINEQNKRNKKKTIERRNDSFSTIK